MSQLRINRTKKERGEGKLLQLCIFVAMENQVRIGTRGSKLALWQAEWVAEQLTKVGLAPEIVVIETKGDKILDVALSKIGSKGVFTEELESALRSGDIHIAMHSAKDVQSDLDNDFHLIAFSKREGANDVLVSRNKTLTLAQKVPMVIGTSSTRRVALLRHLYPQHHIVDMRGNLQTRIRKMDEGQCDAMLLAYAGVHRMGYDDLIAEKLALASFTPPAGQGVIAIEAAKKLDKGLQQKITEAINDKATAVCLEAERSFLETLGGGCSIPSYAHAQWMGKEIVLKAGLLSLDGGQHLKVEEKTVGEKEAAVGLGKQLAQQLEAQGAGDLLQEIRSEQAKQ